MNLVIALTAFTRADDRWAETMQMSPLFTLGLYVSMLLWILFWAFILYRRSRNPREEIAHLEALSRPDANDETFPLSDDSDWWKSSS